MSLLRSALCHIVECLFFSSIFIIAACSNSEYELFAEFDNYLIAIDTLQEINNSVAQDSVDCKNESCSSVIKYIPIDDSEYPFAGIPRIVVETSGRRPVKDRETDVPAILQVFGGEGVESDVMTLTIRGRGNTSWNEMSKKSYKIEFANKQQMFGMPANRDWALISNYADKTLMKNYLMYYFSSRLNAYYSPRCKFVELYLNGEYLGVYLLVETIKIGKNRVNIPQNSDSYIVEFDAHLQKNEQAVHSFLISTNETGKTFRIHDPKNASEEQLLTIENFIGSFETYLLNMGDEANNGLEQWLDIDEYVKHYWIQEFSRNPDASFLTSVYFSWVKGGLIRMGPVWDFDLAFGGHFDNNRNKTYGWYIKEFYWNQYLFKDSVFCSSVKEFWMKNKPIFNEIFTFIDSTAAMLRSAAKNNFKRWNILSSTEFRFHPKAYDSYDETVKDLKEWVRERMNWIDAQYE